MSQTVLSITAKAAFVILAVFLGSATSADSRNLPAYIDSSYKQPQPYFYKIEKNGKTSYLLGSMHVGIPITTYPENIFTQAAAAKFFLVEGDPAQITQKQIALQKKIALYPRDDSLENHISAKAFAKLSEILGPQQTKKISRYKPPVIFALLSHKLMDTVDPDRTNPLYDLEMGIDMQLLRQAQNLKTPIHYLDDRTKIIRQMNESVTVQDLEKILSFPDPMGMQLSCIAKAQRSYLAGSDAGLAEFISNCIGQGLNSTLVKRTYEWKPLVQKALTKGDAFIVVGVAHVLGTHGLKSQLEQQGYHVQRISPVELNKINPSKGLIFPKTRYAN